jgi:5-methylcytosine-specific restriction endonuclease McrA
MGSFCGYGVSQSRCGSFQVREYNSGQWTEARFKSFITSTLRTATQRWPPKFEALKAAFIDRKINKKTGKLAQHFSCASCKGEFVSKDVQVDHKKPVVCPKKGFQGWETYIDRLFCETENLQVLCVPCHKEKTAQEKEQRKKK